MLKKLIRGFGLLLKAEALMYIIFLALAGIIYFISQVF
jgi:hypothetical protein